mgnify:FL=1
MNTMHNTLYIRKNVVLCRDYSLHFTGIDRWASRAGSVHDEAAEGAKLVTAALPRPLPQEEPPLPPAITRHARAYHRRGPGSLSKSGTYITKKNCVQLAV